MAERDGDFTTYVVQRRPQLYRLAYLLCGDAHRAEDIVQIALAKLYVAWDRASRLEGIDAVRWSSPAASAARSAASR